MPTNRSFRRGVFLLCVLMFAVQSRAPATKAGVEIDRPGPRNVATERWDPRAQADGQALRRATQLQGRQLINPQGRTLGRIYDLVLTPDLDQVSYAAIRQAGAFGLGRRLYAIPWSAIEAGMDDTIVAPIEEQELRQNLGFPGNRWPLQGNPRWRGRSGEWAQPAFDPLASPESEDIRHRRVSRILGIAATDPAGRRIGTVRDLVVAVDSGRIPFAIVSYSGPLGLGRRYSAVPDDVVEFQPHLYTAVVHADQQTVRAHAFSPGAFPDLSSPAYTERLHAAYDAARLPDSTVFAYVPPEEPVPTRPVRPVRPPSQPSATMPPAGAADRIEREYLSIFGPGKVRTINGIVTEVGTFQLLGTGPEWIELHVAGDQGQAHTVHLGPRAYVAAEDLPLASGTRIVVIGAQGTAWGRPVILPLRVSVGGRTLKLRDINGRPLWDQVALAQYDGM
jgi:sporulation protein YlmC with PRC-barrel domain